MKKNRKKRTSKRENSEKQTLRRVRPEEKRIELNSKELKINLEKLKNDVKKAYSTMRALLPESISEKKIKPFGNASHIILPKEYAGKKATVIIKR